MNVKNYLSVAALCLMMGACNSGKQTVTQTMGIDLANLDTTNLPGTDFYRYACGGWIKNNPLTDEYSQYGSFTVLAENNRKQIQGLIEELAGGQHQAGSVAQKVGDLYKIAMDSVKLNQEGVKPIEAELKEIAGLKDKKQLYPLLAEMYKKGIASYLALYVGADEMNSNMNAVQIGQYGLSMGDRDYYLLTDESTTKIREAFKAHVEKMYQLAGFDAATAKKGMEVVMDVETRLAKAFRSRVELRDPHANYNKMSMEDIKKNYPTFDWDSYLNGLDLKDVKEIIVGQPASLEASVKILDTLPLADQALYLQWKLIDAAASFLSDDLREQNFDFYSRTMSGAQEMQPRWKTAVGIVSSTLGEAVGQMYVEKYFPAAAKERMIALVKNLQDALGERIKALEWMGDSTKTKALEKLATFHVKIGYPDKWKDYTSLEIKDDSYWANIERASRWGHAEMVAKAGKPVDKDEWLMTPQTVNAYYNPTTNEICFPAAILQPPFFDMNADDAFNYGAIGVVIGHEMTHGFDDQGRQYDKDGNLKDWWTEEDAKKFDERAQVMVAFFDSIEVAPGVHANGKMTLGENIADHGGLQVAFQAFKKATAQAPLEVKDGFTPEQRFFLAYAGVWANNIRPEAVLQMTKIDVHSLGEWRVNGALPHIGAWYDAFGITDKDPMYVPVEKRVSIW
ncbi:M13 family metallopeptidase [Mediterranea massiliensis]|uniref:M13 family metallopeptidase n=1 Tax=Mediterranea massiliensis TaxID=1841865 RepID=UPI0025A47ED3|nr:M13 family metallopeptidase [Mediterranea massiliensis]MDM8336467.1 M13 family metallopeptidase [Mediterranea massiliensis]